MQRTWDEHRHHRNRMIAKRMRILRSSWRPRPDDDDGLRIFGWHYGKLSKYNLVCSCPMCKKPRYDRHKDRWDDELVA